MEYIDYISQMLIKQRGIIRRSITRNDTGHFIVLALGGGGRGRLYHIFVFRCDGDLEAAVISSHTFAYFGTLNVHLSICSHLTNLQIPS